MKNWILAAALIFLTVQIDTASADAVSDAVSALPADASGDQTTAEGPAELTLIGPVKKSGKTGNYRMVVLRNDAEPVNARVFVQWIAANRVEQSFEIREFAALKTDVTDLRGKIERGDLAVFIEVPDSASGPSTYELFVTGPQKYRFRPASN